MYQAQLTLAVISMIVLYFAVLRQIFSKVMNYAMLTMGVTLNLLYWLLTKDDSLIFFVPILLLVAVYKFWLSKKVE